VTEGACSFCDVAAERCFYQGERVVGSWDAFPVSDGHALLVTRRHVASWFEATGEERRELLEAVEAAKAAGPKASHTPDGYNIGINIGRAAGQTIFHLHVHVIPRYMGDVPDPRGGVRHVIPGRANDLAGRAFRPAGGLSHRRPRVRRSLISIELAR
jgi:diadenosine tetraphosphate (Ap4A) HIT family hydrolase